MIRRSDHPSRVHASALWLAVAATSFLIFVHAGAARTVASDPVTPSLQEGEPLPDPAEVGPYHVGMTMRCLHRPSSTNGEPRPVTTVIWYPATASTTLGDTGSAAQTDAVPDRRGAPYPVFAWSHGHGHEPRASSFLTAHLASHGFVVIAPSHAGVALGECASLWAVADSGASPGDRYEERPDDLLYALAWAFQVADRHDPMLAGLLDGARVGVGGHSRGAATALSLAAPDAQFAAVVAMAPASTRLTRSSVAAMRAPTMLMGGVLDDLSPFGEQLELFRLLTSTGPDHRLVSFRRAGHAAFVDLCPPERAGCGPDALPQDRAHRSVRYWTTIFLRHHVARDAAYEALLDPTTEPDDPDVQLESAR